VAIWPNKLFNFPIRMFVTPSQRNRCLAVLDKLCSRPISRPFAQPVDPIRDNLPNYFALVPRPMDLATVRQKLLANEYLTVSSWREDIELIWANSLAVNPRTTLIGAVTIEMQNFFSKLTQHLTDNPDSDWMATLNSLRDELSGISRSSVKRESSKHSGGKAAGEKTKHFRKVTMARPESPKLSAPPAPPPVP
jgi:hypothetical protein